MQERAGSEKGDLNKNFKVQSKSLQNFYLSPFENVEGLFGFFKATF